MSRSSMFSSPLKRERPSSIYHNNFNNLGVVNQNDLSYNSQLSESQAFSNKVFDAKDYATDGLTEQEVHIYKQVFDLYDQTGEGYLNPGKIRNAMKKYGNYNASLQLVYEIQSNFDNNLDGKIDFEEFVRMMRMKPCQQDSAEDVKHIFQQISNYQDEGITPEDLVELALSCNDTLSYEDAVKIIKKLEPNSEKLSMKKFIEFNLRCEF
ncbi:EF hand protein (macronuclear) [Tetrahymena thermophila SB210]|uniref:Calmodulin n=1 Tax=Tetrahymena thermophila (strain SB210) TaxID=312017 RepID=Q23CU0_TETTS|nr:EF hand protein [Tetrahymena thermophila SB210]EAR94400.1 EF hand protein [Tetrahymena thermophila SB210]|eukprot:XP_001014946.1 EF hand protein [Tetrahymena thermophila SB210]